MHHLVEAKRRSRLGGGDVVLENCESPAKRDLTDKLSHSERRRPSFAPGRILSSAHRRGMITSHGEQIRSGAPDPTYNAASAVLAKYVMREVLLETDPALNPRDEQAAEIKPPECRKPPQQSPPDPKPGADSRSLGHCLWAVSTFRVGPPEP